MKIMFHNIYKELNKDNYLFKNINILIGDNILLPFIRLKEYAEIKGMQVGTNDVISIEEADLIVFVDMPNKDSSIFKRAIKLNKPLYMLALESPIVKPETYNKNNHKYFKKVFTWSDDLIKNDSLKYIKINYSYEIPKIISKDINNRSNLSCMIAGNKKVGFKNELYSKRKEIIDWFETNHPEDFDLYGIGWNEATIGDNKYINFIMRRSFILRKLFSKKYTSYKGKVDRKKPILEKYKFSFCYENVKDVDGYITEKIFDSLFTGCVPIYLGANNIDDYIPKNCFIDVREFKSMNELYAFISHMDDKTHIHYLDNIELFLNSAEVEQFSVNHFSKTIIKEIQL
jgi:alpha(1,3/1,4) fucosyltransferase